MMMEMTIMMMGMTSMTSMTSMMSMMMVSVIVRTLVSMKAAMKVIRLVLYSGDQLALLMVVTLVSMMVVTVVMMMEMEIARGMSVNRGSVRWISSSSSSSSSISDDNSHDGKIHASYDGDCGDDDVDDVGNNMIMITMTIMTYIIYTYTHTHIQAIVERQSLTVAYSVTDMVACGVRTSSHCQSASSCKRGKAIRFFDVVKKFIHNKYVRMNRKM
jgi:hypothetical protein